MKKQVIIHTLTIAELGQRIHDQITIPHQTVRITGIHHSLLLETDGEDVISDGLKKGIFFQRTHVAGDLRLQVFGKEDWFFAGNVTIQDRNVFWGDAGIVGQLFPTVATHSFANFRFQTVDVNTKGQAIHVYFRDRWGVDLSQNIKYKVRIYIEVELEKETCQP